MKRVSLNVVLALVLVLFGIVPVCQAFEEENFKSIKLDEFARGDVYFHYTSDLTTILLKDISRTDYIKELIVAEVRLADASTVKYQVEYTSGPSEDPGFFIRTSENSKRIGSKFDGLNFAVFGDNSFYVWGHVNSYFNIRKKYTINDRWVSEVMQPFYYVGLDTIAKKELVLYSNNDGKKQIGNVGTGEKLQIVLNRGEWYLIKTNLEMLGWWRPKDREFYKSKEIENLFYYGD